MKKIIILSILTGLFAGELEVEGDLKVSGNIDAQNQRIKNVGLATDLNDAVNSQFLQDALRDDGNYEVAYYVVKFKNVTGGSFEIDYKLINYYIAQSIR